MTHDDNPIQKRQHQCGTCYGMGRNLWVDFEKKNGGLYEKTGCWDHHDYLYVFFQVIPLSGKEIDVNNIETSGCRQKM